MLKKKVKTYFDTGKEKLIFDAIFSTQHNTSLTITDHPVQVGADISDHAYEDPNRLNFDIGMSDVMKSYTKGQFTDHSSRSVSAYKKLRELQAQRLPITVITRLGTYTNMMIETMTTDDNKNTTHGLRVTVILKQIFVVNVTTVKISERPQKSDETNVGNQNVKEADESFLHKLLNMFN